MLSSSLRRAVRTTTSSSSSTIVPFPNFLIPTTTTAISNTAGAAGFGRRGGASQRRYSSSSKPPVPPNDGSRPIESSQTPANPSAARKVKDAEGRKDAGGGSGAIGVVKSRQGSSAALLNLPSVPSTQHTPLEDIQLASFFSVHRPISVSTSIPPPTNEAAFNAIFDLKQSSRRSNRTADVINTLTSAVASMEGAMQGRSATNAEQPPRIIHLDDVALSEEDLHSSIAEFASRLTPFQPPPAPVPQEESAATQETEGSADANIRTYSTLLTIRETSYADGQRTFETSLAPLVPTQDTAFIDEPVPDAGKTYIERTVNRTMYTISVRRQRKLKMKKHKFKKLLRKTRTLRRKLDKA
ncbi:conserved hypothetical protein [Talaromyces stipitatus ATCC 10500]|uniref:Small ribosomal subunit protein mS38 n=1 Tax=Talaromyces stipitatus (strain ATCC 10500 / CBS 375.48 / QM 6759 / NRRL 1006) TaxID=441959 RepID=B8MPE5_TALSN|nr:uncharacterized protein TSTA_105930 [Talaromyces stipitatus ATCC 10500]EED14384.1 conserved hypothetical protein [Talaromyces stipitatus ATCC 10500]